ncbi:MAG: hypothetical protein NVV63_03955 [Opitutus sp.]|nr:hypothetical protein [Opitutus sp.]
MSTDEAEEAVARLEFAAGVELLVAAVGVAGGEFEAEIAGVGRSGGAEAQRHARHRERLVGEIAERRLVTQAIRVLVGFATAEERVAARDFDAPVEDSTENDLVGGRRDELERRVAIEARQIDEREHRIGVQRVEDERLRAAFFRRILFERDIADGAAEVGEVHRDEFVFERDDLRLGRVGRDRREGGRRHLRGRHAHGLGRFRQRRGTGGGRRSGGRIRLRRRQAAAEPHAEERGDDEKDADGGVLFVHEK